MRYGLFTSGAILLGAMMMSFPSPAAQVTPERQDALRHLLLHDCGSCHGLRMTGGLGPPLTPAALANKSPSLLREVILQGRPGTPMPPWAGFMTEHEAAWLVNQLQGGGLAP